MVWFRYKKKFKIIQKRSALKFIKKFQKNGVPDTDYFGSGMYANYLYEPMNREMQICEVYPNLTEKAMTLNHIVTETPRSFEIYKQIGSNIARLAIRTTAYDIDRFARALNLDYEKKNEKTLPVSDSTNNIANSKYCFFDVELIHQFNFTVTTKNQEPIMNRLIQIMTSSKDVGIMIQFVFTKSLMWNTVAENTASNLSRYLKKTEENRARSVLVGFDRHFLPKLSIKEYPKNEQLSSSTYQIGKKIEKIYHQKASLTPYTLAIRGIIVGNQMDMQNTLQNISSVFGSLEFVGDSLSCFNYDVDYIRGMSWIENNAIASEYSTKILEKNANMWSDMRWGKGRDFVPFLCLSADEFPIFVSLPTDPTLSLSYRRRKLKGMNYDKSVFRLGIPI